MAWVMKGEISMAVRMLRRNRTRSMLTMIGIIIGVASVVTVVAIGQGVTQQVATETQQLGSDLITVRPAQLNTGSSMLGGFGQGGSYLGTLSTADIQTVVKTPGIKTVVPLSLVAASAGTNESRRVFSLPIIGTSADFPTLLDKSLAFGGFLTDEATDANKVILGADAAATLFSQNVPLGQTVQILGQNFIVVGILKSSQVSPLISDIDFNSAIFMSNAEAQTLTNGSAHVYEIVARPKNPNQASAVIDRLRGILLAAHGGQQDFSVSSEAQALAASNGIINLLTTLIAGVAIISLLVGGVGIMNVMLVSVTERMHEIGIRKAVGATNRQILRQFIIEAVVLSVTGALIGIIVALFIAVALQLTTNLAPIITWQVLALACLVSVAVGVLFGTAPALKASRRDPISALRNL